MKMKTLPLFLSLIAFYFTLANATIVTVRNNCQYTIWPAAALGYEADGLRVDLGGSGMRLDPGGVWNLNVNPASALTSIWARTNCQFDEAGNGGCETGDCEGRLECKGIGQPPHTMAEYALNQFNNLDFFDISLVDGFNVPMEFSPNSKSCTRGIRCSADITRQCPNELKAPGGCNNPCTVFKTDQYCCNSGSCGPTDFSKFFKDRCPDVYTYPTDDQTSTFTCPGGTNYRVVFCP